MRSTIRLPFVAAALLAVASLGLRPALRAADESETPPPMGPRAPVMEKLVEDLGLTADQQTAIAPILEKEKADLQALQASEGTRREKFRRAREIIRQGNDDIRAQLNPDQQARFDAALAEARKKMRERMRERREAGQQPAADR